MTEIEKVGSFITIERGIGPDGRVAIVRFDRGDKLNALSMQALRDLRDAARRFEDDTATSVVVLTGTKTAFSAGFDLNDNESYHRDGLGMGERRQLLRLGPQMCEAWERMDQVTIAAIEGHCIGGGAALVVSLDFRTCGEGSHFRIPEVALGMNMSWGSVPRILHLVGPARTKQAIILANERISAAQALQWGLVENVVPDGEVVDAARHFALRVAAHPPLPVRMVKRSVNALSTALDDLSAHMDVDQYALTTMSEDFREGVASFKERREPKFRGR
jgi:enoyl-CoA hydratase